MKSETLQVVSMLRLDLFTTSEPLGIAFLGLLFFLFALFLSMLTRRLARRMESFLTDVTGVRFASAFLQVLVFLIAFMLYSNIVPGLRALGTALLAGVSVASIVLGLAAQTTLSNIVAGGALVLFRPIRVGDSIRFATPEGVMTAEVEIIGLGHTRLRGSAGEEVIVPNSVMVNSVIIKKREVAA
ncbi:MULTISPECIES: mechanosensitive ion channel domain-containing protein [Prosthecochloris]|uniref:Mechanosensitive ion channel n=1 Tax=Prosthecochloris vibrioformis TaxID=1098 RepID=A0A5C4RZ61_PROVB|nr:MULTISPECIES: mechanosensitive ion channel domain-containing protein [Prosthecochloris]ANT65389.1 putative MscS family protein YkuT [Prosthecochloris sp. CIB 2401]TNJ35951.1 mechanosensitive ion channel [Prosthecochloris vibrioformis]